MAEWKSNKYWRNRPVEERIQNARIPARFSGKSLSEYDVLSGDEEAYNAVSLWAKNVNEHIKTGMGLYLYGPTGVGKTHLAQAALVKAIRDNSLSGLFVSTDRYLDMVYDSERNKGELPDAYSDPSLLKYMRRVYDIVVLDGLGSERTTTPYAKNAIVSFVSNRYEEKLVTIITSVYPPNELSNVYGKRLNSLLQDSCFFINVDGKDHRTAFNNAG